MKKILLQLDCDHHASSFDAVVATDAGVEQLLQYASVTPDNVVSLVHGAMFTRGGESLANTAIFIGGSDVAAAEAVFSKVLKTFFGPVRVSVMFDANGCNTTAAAAVVSASRHLSLKESTALVLGGTGPVGQRVARLLAAAGCHVRIGSRDRARAQKALHHIGEHVPHDLLTPVAAGNEAEVSGALEGAELVFACGAAGVQLVSQQALSKAGSVRVAIDLNAVPPSGIEGISAMDKAKEIAGRICYGAIGVGGLKMKTHKAAIAKLFESNDSVFDASEIFELANAVS
jgi:threonine dehydrogenase-like Zn-dependent dehydrogenase